MEILVKRIQRGEVGRKSPSGNVGIAGAVHGNAAAEFLVVAAKVRGVHQGREPHLRRINLRHESIVEATSKGGLERIRCGEVRGGSCPGYVSIAGAVYGNVAAELPAAPAEEGRVDECRACGIDLRHEGI